MCNRIQTFLLLGTAMCALPTLGASAQVTEPIPELSTETLSTEEKISANEYSVMSGTGPMPSVTDNAMLWQQYQLLQTGVSLEGGQSCNCGMGTGYNLCGCNTELFPWIRGSGNCDQWCVGPWWEFDAGGLLFFREDANWDRVIAAVGSAPSLVQQFDHGPGGRVFITGYN